MKEIEIESLSRFKTFLSNVDVGEYNVLGDIRAYSCKLQGHDKKVSKSLDQEVQMGSSPFEMSKSPVGPLSDASSRKTLIHLIFTLNNVYPDYNFAMLRAHHFRKEPDVNTAAEVIDSQLLELSRVWETTTGCEDSAFLDDLWNAIEKAVTLEDCDVYSYKPDGETEPYGEDEGRLWVFNYFFYNRKLKKILYISCRGTSKVLPQDTSDMQGYSYYTEDDDEVVGNMEDLV
eukprot:jgi/Botrbrau1/5224/Bobra.0172s0088.1